MKSIPVYNLDKKEVGTVEVPEIMVATAWNADLVHQVLVAQDANSRNTVAHAKDRSEVSGGGKKPWKQKGTGRSRHGSIRSPLWSGGGVTHGPRNEKSYEQKVNKKMKDAALLAVISKKFADNELSVVEAFDGGSAKTKTIAGACKQFVEPRQSAVFIFSQEHKDLRKGVRNIARFNYLSPTSLNVRDILKAKHVIFEKAALEEAASHYKKALSRK